MGIDPIALRLANTREQRMTDVLEKLRRESEWDRPPAAGRGRGMSAWRRHVGGGATSVKLIVQAGGTIVIETGIADQGGGNLTAVQRVVSTTLGIERERVRLVHRGTDVAGNDPGAGGSRGTHIVGNAALNAVEQLNDALRPAGWDGSPANWPDAVDRLARATATPPVFVGTYDSSKNPLADDNNYAAYAVEVSVDAETGVVDVEQVVFVCDTGTVINPIAHRGQVDGGFMFGFGHAMTEELIVEDGRILNLSLADYKLPSMRDIPPFRAVLMDEVPGPGPFGAKSAGELNTGGVGPAIANAVAAACGARLTVLPITSERVLKLLAQKNGRS